MINALEYIINQKVDQNAKNRLVEVIPAATTSAETIERTVQYCKTLGKVVIVCADRPGFVVNRFFVPWLNVVMMVMMNRRMIGSRFFIYLIIY